MRKELKKPLLEVVKVLGITLAVYAIMRFLLPLVIPFLIAFLLAKLLHPLVEKINKKIKIKKGLIAGAVLLFFVGILLWAVWSLGKNLIYQLQYLFANLPSYQEKVSGIWQSCCMQMEDWTGIQAETLSTGVTSTLPKLWENMKGTLLPSLMSSSFSWVKGICVTVGVCVVTGVSTLLMLTQYVKIKESVEKGTLGRMLLRIFRRVYQAGGGYIKAQLIIMLAVCVICAIGLFCTGNSYALLAGMGIGLCDALPFLGTGTVFIPWALVEIFRGEYMLAAVYAVIYAIASLARELLEPKLVGDKLGIPPLAVIISVYIGLCIYGLWGFALGPLSYILIREIYQELKEA